MSNFLLNLAQRGAGLTPAVPQPPPPSPFPVPWAEESAGETDPLGLEVEGESLLTAETPPGRVSPGMPSVPAPSPPPPALTEASYAPNRSAVEPGPPAAGPIPRPEALPPPVQDVVERVVVESRAAERNLPPAGPESTPSAPGTIQPRPAFVAPESASTEIRPAPLLVPPVMPPPSESRREAGAQGLLESRRDTALPESAPMVPRTPTVFPESGLPAEEPNHRAPSPPPAAPLSPRPVGPWEGIAPDSRFDLPAQNVPADTEPPRIEVRIGRIEIKRQPPTPPPAPAPPEKPAGFERHERARRYLNRRWY